jgi:hypothetical protein
LNTQDVSAALLDQNVLVVVVVVVVVSLRCLLCMQLAGEGGARAMMESVPGLKLS